MDISAEAPNLAPVLSHPTPLPFLSCGAPPALASAVGADAAAGVAYGDGTLPLLLFPHGGAYGDATVLAGSVWRWAGAVVVVESTSGGAGRGEKRRRRASRAAAAASALRTQR